MGTDKQKDMKTKSRTAFRLLPVQVVTISSGASSVDKSKAGGKKEKGLRFLVILFLRAGATCATMVRRNSLAVEAAAVKAAAALASLVSRNVPCQVCTGCESDIEGLNPP